MSQFSRDPRGARDFSSPQVRVRGANDFRQYSSQRLRLPNEGPPIGPKLRRLFGALLTLAAVGGIGVGVYFGVTELIEEDETPAATSVEATEQAEPAEGQGSTSPPDEPAAAEQPAADTASTEADSEGAAQDQASQSSEPEAAQPDAERQGELEAAPPSVSAITPTVSEEAVTPAQIGGAEIVAERVTAEAIPSGIPRTLADGADYDPSEPATVFTSRWPVGTTLRLTRLPGATLLTDEQQAAVVGAQALVVVRGTEATNTDLQMSPAAFNLVAFHEIERIIAVRVEVAAPPP